MLLLGLGAAVAAPAGAAVTGDDEPGKEFPLFDFTDRFYTRNGINVDALVGRRSGSDGLSAVDESPDRIHRDVRVTFTLPGDDHSGNTLFWTVLADLAPNPFTPNKAGREARRLAEQSPVYVFPTRDGAAGHREQPPGRPDRHAPRILLQQPLGAVGTRLRQLHGQGVQHARGPRGARRVGRPERARTGRHPDHRDAVRARGPDRLRPEPSKRNAIHGLLRWQPWRVRECNADQVVMHTRLHPVTGYPFMLDVAIEYALGAGGLTVTTTAQNSGGTPCPYGSGQHPYLSAGDGLVDECTVQLQAGTWIRTDAERQIPIGTEPVAGTPYDVRSPPPLAGLVVDSAFPDLVRDIDGLAWVRLGRPDGSTVELWADGSYPVIQLYTADSLAADRRPQGSRRRADDLPAQGLPDRRPRTPAGARGVDNLDLGRATALASSRRTDPRNPVSAKGFS